MLVEAQIREYVKALLQPLDVCRDHIVFDTAEIPDDADDHWIVVATGDEFVQPTGIGSAATGIKQSHTVELLIDVMKFARVRPMDGCEATLAIIIPVLFADPRMGGLVKSFRLTGKRRDKSVEGIPMARIRLQCETVYQTFDRDPSTSV